jgi:hypothetical protein
MKSEFTALIQHLIAEQGRDALFNAARCKAFLSDNQGVDINARRLLQQVVESGITVGIANASNVAAYKAQAVHKLQADYYYAPNVANDVVDVLIGLIRTSMPVQQPAAVMRPVYQPPVQRPSVQQPMYQAPVQQADYHPQPSQYQQYQQPIQQYSANTGKPYIKKRSLVAYIFLTILTLGIYGLYWIYKIAKDMNTICEGDMRKTSGLFKYLVFNILTRVSTTFTGCMRWKTAYRIMRRVTDLRSKKAAGLCCSGGY